MNRDAPKIPTWGDYLAFDGGPSSHKWQQISDDWHCPGCDRSKFELLHWAQKNRPKRRDPAKLQLTPFMGWQATLNEHHDHGQPPRFEPVIVCDQCNAVDAQVKARFRDMARDFSFAAEEIRRIVTPRPHQSHLVDYGAARQIYREARRAAAALCWPAGTDNNMLDSTSSPYSAAAARAMLDAFISVGAASFNLTWTNSAGEPRRSHKGIGSTELTRAMTRILDQAIADRLNLIVRPYGPTISFIQLDDLTADKLPRLAPPSFLIIETSPNSFQAWLALSGKLDKEFARRIRRGAGADLSASGATRVAGSLNFKARYAPDFPRVAIRAAQPGRVTTPAELARLGLVAPPDEFAALPSARFTSPRTWPSYQKALAGAPRNRAGDGPDRSKADYVFAMTCISWGFGIEETADRLMAESEKARAEGRGYADLTAKNAAQAVARRQQQQQQPARTAGGGPGHG
jgi:RepB DNA-primase from phage plasmid